MTIHIDLMKIKDLKQVLEIEQEAFSTPWSENAFLMEINGDNRYAHYIVARDGYDVVGYLGTWFILDEAHITNVACKKSYRRQGIGTKLLQHLFDICQKLGVRAVTLEVRESNIQAQQLYKKMGFEQKGVRPKYYQDNQENALIMWKVFAKQDEV